MKTIVSDIGVLPYQSMLLYTILAGPVWIESIHMNDSMITLVSSQLLTLHTSKHTRNHGFNHASSFSVNMVMAPTIKSQSKIGVIPFDVSNLRRQFRYNLVKSVYDVFIFLHCRNMLDDKVNSPRRMPSFHELGSNFQ